VKIKTAFSFALVAASSCLVACGGEGDDPTTGDEQHLDTGPKLKFSEYQVLFTNPVCKEYRYDQEVVSNAGEVLEAKPRNVFCSQTDSAGSAARPESPQNKLITWIQDPTTTEIFFTYLSFSNSTVTKELCKAITERDVKVTFVIDSSSDRAKADQLLACQPQSGDPERAPRLEMRGHEGGIGYAHNKLFLVNPGSDTVKLAFSSGNMSSGVVLHHENWHFITVPADTYFAQAHLCMMEGELDHHTSKSEYKSFITSCKAAITAKEESDIKTFFAPAEGARASQVLLNGVKKATSIDIGAHRFSYTTLIKALKSRLTGSKPPEMRIITDDDTYWVGQGDSVGDNQSFEYWNVQNLVDIGAEAKWMETNHEAHLLHHNKFLILNMPKSSTTKSAVFGGAGNLTGTAFNENWENFYYITIPSVVEQFRTQYEHMWNDLATATEDLPAENILPPTE
jgi:hypothetical protein